MKRTRLVAAAAVVGLTLAATGIAVAVHGGAATVQRTTSMVPVGAEPDGSAVALDTTVFRPAGRGPFAAVLLAHGFGGSKNDETDDALYLARHGFLALTYSARGFGASGGRIHIDAPGFEVKDARALLDLLAERSDVVQDKPGDPRVGVVGGSYGGALSLLLAGYDARVDALAPAITWNDLGQALFPQFGVQRPSESGVFKRAWAGLFFSSGSRANGVPISSCGRFDPDVCAAFQQSAAAGSATARMRELLLASSPASVLARIHAPALIIQGEADSLFPLSEGVANARGIAAGGTAVKEIWYGGGHDGGVAERGRLRSLTLSWLRRWLQGRQDKTGPVFEASVVTESQDGTNTGTVAVRAGSALPDSGASQVLTRLGLSGGAQTVVSPAGGSPAALTGLPGFPSALSRVTSALGSRLTPEGQSARFETAPLKASLLVVGAPAVDIVVRSSAADAVLFASVYDMPGGGGADTLPELLVSPVRLRVGVEGTAVHVALPAIVHNFPVGHRLRVVVSSTDQAYALPGDARSYRIALTDDPMLSLPDNPTRPVGGSDRTLLAVALGLLLLLLIGSAVAFVRGRRLVAGSGDESLADVPIVIDGLVKTYGDGFRAVSELSFRVERGEVLGLLGPNGAGKTTAVRVMLGLLRPTEGSVRIFGHTVLPGAAVLSRVGAFVEGPGLVPHLTGRQNLELYWRATGRPTGDAQLAEALEVAGLDDDLDRRVRTYSQGMRQRLAIAQAMLGLPDLLILDEPTNGLDPPQIREMREVLARYAATGRTVVVSSHLLSEVEQTCTHVVVMHHGRLVAQGPVAELVGSATSVSLDVDDVERAHDVAVRLPGAQDVRRTATGLSLRLVGTSRAELTRALVHAGVGVERLAPQRGLEEAFLALVGED